MSLRTTEPRPHPQTPPAVRRFQVRFARGIGLDEALNVQLAAVDRLRRDPEGDGLLLIVEHTPMVTLGRGGSTSNVLASAQELAAAGVAFHRVRRGGDVTYHGPGQITLYPVYPLAWWSRSLRAAMRRLEAAGIAYLAGHGVQAGRAPGLTGVWVGEDKVAAIGIAVRHWITYYGMAVNVAPDLDHFRLIRPCGIADRGVTSLARLTGREYNLDQEMRALAHAFARVHEGARLRWL